MPKTSPVRVLVILIAVALIASIFGTAVILNGSQESPGIMEVWLPLFFIAFSVPITAIGFVLAVLGLGWLLANAIGLLGQVQPSSGTFHWRLGFNPFNAIFLPEHLTDRGLIARQRILRGTLIFLAGMLLAVPAIMVTEFFP